MAVTGLLGNRAFIYGVVAGVVLVYAFHHFASPLPGTGRSPAAKRAARSGG